MAEYMSKYVITNRVCVEVRNYRQGMCGGIITDRVCVEVRNYRQGMCGGT
jgi:hypothetical protein